MSLSVRMRTSLSSESALVSETWGSKSHILIQQVSEVRFSKFVEFVATVFEATVLVPLCFVFSFFVFVRMPHGLDLKGFVIGQYLAGASTAEIAQREEIQNVVSKSTINRWIAKYDNGGMEALKVNPKIL